MKVAGSTSSFSRRSFLKTGVPLLAAPSLALGDAPASNRVRVAVMGLSRGRAHIRSLSQIPGVEIVAVCDVDSERLARGASDAEKATGKKPAAIEDFRKILEDKEIDALTIAAPNFWHAPASVLACKAGKHVYVEKPGSYCAREAELIVDAARECDRRVQMGNQRRSDAAIIEAMQKLREGVIGTLRSARCFYTNTRGTIGKGKRAKVPERLNYELWQGPAPRRPYKDNLVHYNWHWKWHWGNGELGNNGVHALDLARWALGVDLPLTSSCHGGRYHFEDDQETPDTATASFDFGEVYATWEGSSCHKRIPDKLPFVEIYGDGGCMKIEGSGAFAVFDEKGGEVEGRENKLSDVPHFTNFIDAIRDGAKLNAEIGDAQMSAMLCHLGNISYRTGRVIGAPEKNAEKKHPRFWSREYANGWEVKV